jgi:hypothetical protein
LRYLFNFQKNNPNLTTAQWAKTAQSGHPESKQPATKTRLKKVGQQRWQYEDSFRQKAYSY